MTTESTIIRQRTDEWYTARLGKFTASNFCALMAKPADKSATWSKSAINYIQDLALQLFLNEYTWRQDNDATRWGMRNEEKALQEFSNASGFRIKDPGFLIHPGFPEVGATPDAFVIEDNQSESLILAQVKCPYGQKNHLHYAKIERDQLAIDQLERVIPEAITMRDDFLEEYRNGGLFINRI